MPIRRLFGEQALEVARRAVDPDRLLRHEMMGGEGEGIGDSLVGFD